jgi:hypothetical protein
MEVVFTYLPVRLKEITEIYLEYSIKNLNSQNIIPFIYSDNDYFKNRGLEYKWVPFNVGEKYKQNTLWSYPKLKVLSIINMPFIHLDNDFIVEDFKKLNDILKPSQLNVCYKRKIGESQIKTFNDIFSKYTNGDVIVNELNNTSIIATEKYDKINEAYLNVLDIIERNFDFFSKRYNDVPPITLNQQYVNLYFDNVNYLFSENPSYDNLKINGVCHMAEKTITSRFLLKKTMI